VPSTCEVTTAWCYISLS